MHHTPLAMGQLVVTPGQAPTLFTVCHAAGGFSYQVTAPVFEIEGNQVGSWAYISSLSLQPLARGGQQITLEYDSTALSGLKLLVDIRFFPDSSVVRLRYRLESQTTLLLTKHTKRDSLCYLAVHGTGMASADLAEIQLSHFDPVVHSYLPHIEQRRSEDLYDGLRFVGPITICHSGDSSLLVAYEHGSDYPHGFLTFTMACSGTERSLSLVAVEGNYYAGQPIGQEVVFESIWLQLAVAPLPFDALLQRYRAFVHDEMCDDLASRAPLLFYNTWNYQERNKYFRGLPYLHEMHASRMAAEAEVAHHLGIDVFVVDTGWYSKTGDWQVNRERFPDGLDGLRQQLTTYGMRLGLWFNPSVAALTSAMYRTHTDCEMTYRGDPTWRGPVWETEESTKMCLASRYADAYIEEMVRLHHELGVSYFKWDGINQWDCDSPDHHHGTTANAPEERAACYAFMMGQSMIRIAHAITRRCPGAIVDFDITEAGRFVGLGFLAAGKYFLVNNGPYFHDFDIPQTTRIDPDTINVFFYPGAARPRVCRQGLKYDPIVPATLFLTHYLPDGPPLAQRNSLAALSLGGNGLWGDLLGLTGNDIALLAGELVRYKQVSTAVAHAYPRTRGFIGASPEVHEKLDSNTATGLIACFTVTACTVEHLTQPLDPAVPVQVYGADTWARTADGRLLLTVQLKPNDARIVFVTRA